jgi:predicted nucleic acid-binding Zn ribbon protein
MSRFLQGEESDAFSWLNPSGYIDSVKERSGQRRKLGFGSQLDEDSSVAKKTTSGAWKYVLATTAVVLMGGGLYLYKTDGKASLASFFRDARLRLALH